jgi:hypothetical protein
VVEGCGLWAASWGFEFSNLAVGRWLMGGNVWFDAQARIDTN